MFSIINVNTHQSKYATKKSWKYKIGLKALGGKYANGWVPHPERLLAHVFLILKLDCHLQYHHIQMQSICCSLLKATLHIWKKFWLFPLRYPYVLIFHCFLLEWFLFMAYTKIHLNTISVFLKLVMTEGWSHPTTWRETKTVEEKVSGIAAAAISNLPIQIRIFEALAYECLAPQNYNVWSGQLLLWEWKAIFHW